MTENLTPQSQCLNKTILPRFILHLPTFAAFSSQMALMILELDASRLMGSHFGNSFYTWAAVIGVILWGNSLGSLWGGKIANRKQPFLLSWLFFSTAISCIFSLLLNRILGLWIPIPGLHWPLQILVTAFILFALPSILFGALTPLTLEFALPSFPLSPSGFVVGKIFAWGALGSILGTMLAGFLFLAHLGSIQIWALTVIFLVSLAALFFFAAYFKKIYQDPLPSNQLPQGQAPQNLHGIHEQPLSPISASSSGREKAGPQEGLKPVFLKYAPYFIAFSSAASIMGIELLGGRLISRYYGNSLYTWTSNIGVILTGIMVGYIIGGRLAKHSHPEKFLPYLFGSASFFVFFAIIVVHFFWTSSWLRQGSLSWQVLVASLLSILLPAVVLGAISPINYQLVLKNSAPSAPVIGALNAWAIGGSLCGTLLTGFWLIAVWGTIHTVLALAIVLALIGGWLGRFRWMYTGWIILLIGISGMAAAKTNMIPKLALPFVQTLGLRVEDENLLFAKDSHYQYVKVYRKEQSSTRDIRVLALDSLIHGFIDLKNPSNLRYEYEHIYQNITERYLQVNDHPSAFFIGAGSYTFPRWMLFRWPKARIDVAELDPVVVSASHLALGLPQNTPIHTFTGDARGIIKNLPPSRKYDLVFGDAFNDLSVPWHLTTLEFIKLLKTHLKPGGAYLLNVIDNYDNGMMVGACYLTLKKAFRHVDVFCTNPLQIQNIRDTFILLASDRPLNLKHWRSGPIGYGDGILLEPRNLNYFALRCNGLVLTDNFAPVENLLAPVVKKRKLR